MASPAIEPKTIFKKWVINVKVSMSYDTYIHIDFSINVLYARKIAFDHNGPQRHTKLKYVTVN